MERVSELPTRGAFVCGVLLGGWNVHGVFLDFMAFDPVCKLLMGGYH
jgi:hypothetical protein